MDGNRKYHTENGRTLDALGGHTSTVHRKKELEIKDSEKN